MTNSTNDWGTTPAAAPATRARTLSDALAVTDSALRQTALAPRRLSDSLTTSDGTTSELLADYNETRGDACAMADGTISSVTGIISFLSTRNINGAPRPNGWLDSRYPDGVDGFQPNMSLVPMLDGDLDSRYPFGPLDLYSGATVSDGVVLTVHQSISLLDAVNMQIVPVSLTGIIDSRYWDGVPPLFPDITAPPPPASLDVSVSAGDVVGLWWPAVADTIVPGYETSGVSAYDVRRNGAHLDYTSDTSYSYIAPAGAAYYNVRAIDVAGNESTDSETVYATISAGSGTVLSNAQLATIGFISITANSFNADPTGITDASSAIQAAIDYAAPRDLSVWFPSGTYKVSRTVRCYQFRLHTSEHGLYGATLPTRPVIKLASGASGFQTVATPRPVVCYAMWQPNSGDPSAPSDLTFNPYTGPDGWSQIAANNFSQVFHNIDIDTGRNPGADGIAFAVAQGAYLGNCRVDATSSNTGVVLGGGRSSPAFNIEVQGGRYGVSATAPNASNIGAGAGITYVGLRCYGQTIANLLPGDLVPTVVVGFHFTRSAGASVTMVDESATGWKTLALIDGTIETTGAVAFDDTVQKTVYLRNVYVRGTNSLVKVGGTTYSGSGTWKRINEFCVNDLDGTALVPTVPTGTNVIPHYSLIDGTVAHDLIAVNSITSAVDAPPSYLVSQHIADIPMHDGDDYILLPAPAVTDAVNSINAAINSAAAAGHNRVLLRAGTYYVGDTINMLAHTQLIGTGLNQTIIYTHSSWRPTSGSPYIIETANDANGTAFIGHLKTMGRMLPTSSNNWAPYGRFSAVNWRVGKNSRIYDVNFDYEYVVPSYYTPARTMLNVTGNGGGRIYGPEKNGRGFNHVDARVVKVQSTTQPLQLYGCQCEISKKEPPGSIPYTNIEVRNAQNVRIYSMKREGQSPSVMIHDCINVACYGGGSMLGQEKTYYGVYGSSTNILIAMQLVQAHTNSSIGHYTVVEDLNTSAVNGIVWPRGVSVYKRGHLADTSMVDGALFVPTFLDEFTADTVGVITADTTNWALNLDGGVVSIANTLPLGTGQGKYFVGSVTKSAGLDVFRAERRLTVLSGTRPSYGGQTSLPYDMWYGWRMRFDRMDALGVAGYPLQWHDDPGGDNTNPCLALRWNGSLLELLLQKPYTATGSFGADWSTAIGSFSVGDTLDLAFRVRWCYRSNAMGGNGAVDVYINDEPDPRVEYRGSTAHAPPYTSGAVPFIKCGGYWSLFQYSAQGDVGDVVEHSYDQFRVQVQSGSLFGVKPQGSRT